MDEDISPSRKAYKANQAENPPINTMQTVDTLLIDDELFVGDAVGLELGLELLLGDTVGWAVGVEEGDGEGLEDGDTEGIDVGAEESDGDGLEEGEADKTGVGFAEGETDGATVIDGEADGRFDGDALGFPVGHRLSTP